MISEQTEIILNELPLADIMRHNGYAIDHKTNRNYFYRCPFHQETGGSFAVEKHPNKGQMYAGFRCFACDSAGGFGAITLQKRLLEQAGEKCDFPAVANRLAKDFNLIIEGDFKNGFFHRRKPAAPQPEISFDEKEGALTQAELRAIGCQSVPVYRRECDDEGETVETALRDEQGETLYKYSFGPDFYTSSCSGNNFDSNVLKEQFNLCSLNSYTTPERADKDGVLSSYQVSATDSYPVFLFRYQDDKGWWARKYEPYFRETTDKNGRKNANYKFTWWYEGNRNRDDLRSYLYGNADVMRALQTGVVTSSDEAAHPTVEIERRVGDKKRMKKVFRRIVICSGPRDAINVYFHSNAHVVFPHSENTPFSREMIDKLFQIAATVYVLYDIDKTGLMHMNNLALKYVDLRPVYLPEALATLQNPRTGKACKDAEEFFNLYPMLMRKNERLSQFSINRYFNDMLVTAKRMRFWDEQLQSKKDEDGQSFKITKYTLNFDSMAQFLSANGFFKYLDESRNTKFVHVRNNIVDVVDESEALSTAKEIMKEFLLYNSNYYTEDLSNAISTQKRVGRDTMSNIKEIKLNFTSWGKDFDYFFFRNCAVKVTKDSIDPVNYIDLPFHVNRSAILDFDFRAEHAPLFDIVENPQFSIERRLYEERMADKSLSEEEKMKETATFIAFERMYKFHLKFPKEIDKMPIGVQYLYDTSRIHWRKESIGLPLTVAEQQRQGMHFISKVATLGFVLSRYRSGTKNQMAIVTDYSVVDEGKNSGGTGKSILRDFLELVRKVRYIPGKSFRKKENMATNFQEFQDTVDSLCFIDDLRDDIPGEEFFNITDTVTVKTLYNNIMTLPRSRTPKIIATMNKIGFNLNDDSVARRLFISMASDYYHAPNINGTEQQYSPDIKFGKDIILEATEEERNQSVYMMLQCCRFYLGSQESIIPPMEKDGMMRVIHSSIRDPKFVSWANEFFASKWHFCRPIAIDEMVASCLDHKGEDITTITIKRNRDDVLAKVKMYCLSLHYTINPQIVYRSDTASKYPRHYAWVTPFVNDRPTKQPREKKYSRCCFFYRMGDEPKTLKEILPCPEKDEERLEARETEWGD